MVTILLQEKRGRLIESFIKNGDIEKMPLGLVLVVAL